MWRQVGRAYIFLCCLWPKRPISPSPLGENNTTSHFCVRNGRSHYEDPTELFKRFIRSEFDAFRSVANANYDGCRKRLPPRFPPRFLCHCTDSSSDSVGSWRPPPAERWRIHLSTVSAAASPRTGPKRTTAKVWPPMMTSLRVTLLSVRSRRIRLVTGLPPFFLFHFTNVVERVALHSRWWLLFCGADRV